MKRTNQTKRQLSYLKGIVIVHGTSEFDVAKSIQDNLRLSIKIDGKHKGENSLQVTSVIKEKLRSYPYDSISSLLKEYENKKEIKVSGRGKNRVLKNFRIFIIMDTDDCTEEQKQAFINKQMFLGHPLYDYIVPIYTSPAMEDVMVQCGFMKKKIKDSEKGTWYKKNFPVDKNRPMENIVADIEEKAKKLEACPNTNLEEYFRYCLAIREEIQK